METNKKIIGMFGILIIVLVLVSSNVFAFAVSSKYWKENPLLISPGETKEIKIILQNMAGTEDIKATGVITEGSEIAKITGFQKEYSVPVGGKTEVNIRVRIPADVEIDDSYDIKITFTIITDNAGPLGLGSSVEKSIPVLIIKESEKEGINLWIYAIGLVVLIILIIIIIKIIKKRKKTKR